MLRSRFSVALIALAVTAVAAVGQDTVDLKWKFEKGKAFYQDLTTKTEQKMTVMGMNITQTQEQTFYLGWTPETEKDKTWDIKQTIEGIKMSIQIGGNPVTFDSTKDTTASNPLSDFFKALVGSSFTISVQAPEMKVTKVTGAQAFREKLIQANQQMKPLLDQILSDDALKQMADPAFGVAPGKPVKKGDNWERKSTLNLGPIGTFDSTYKYTLEGPDEKNKEVQKIKVDTTMKYNPPSEAGAVALPFKIKKANLTSKDATGTILFDVAKGRVISSQQRMKLEGTLEIEIGGQNTTVELSQTQDTSMKTSDTNPVPGKK